MLYEAVENGKQVYEQNAARMMTDILKGVMTVGTARGLDLGEMPSAGKTGTTNDHRDGWFCGFTRYYTTAVWVGYDVPQEMKDLSGATYPGHIWQDFMKKLHEAKEPLDFMPYVSYNDSTHVAEPEPEEPTEEELQPEKPEAPVEIPGQVEEPEQPEAPVEIPGEVEQPEQPETPQEPADEEIIEPEEPTDPEEPEESDENDGDVIIID